MPATVRVVSRHRGGATENRMIDDLFSRLRAGFAAGRTLPVAWRREQLAGLKALVCDNEAAWLEVLRQDLGKCTQEAYVAEIGYLAKEVDFVSRRIAAWMQPRKVGTPLIAQPGTSYIVPEPRGLVLIIGAWNYPLQLTLAPLVAAVAAGNAAVLKPSEVAPATSAKLAELLPKYLDPACYAVVEGGVPETSALLEQRFDHILYTGGERVARIVMTAAARHLTPVTLELGGKSPCYVDRDVDLEVAASRITWGKFMNAGQTCIAPDYVLAHAAIADDLREALIGRLREFYGEDAARSPDYARIVNDRHFDRLVGLLAGQRIVYGGRHDRGSRYFEPTLVDQPALDSVLMQEEIFGPILPILTVAGAEEAAGFARARPKPLALYVFSDDHGVQQQLTAGISAGSVCINDTMMFMAAPELPFGGVGASGMGRYSGWYGFETMSHMKAVMRRGFRFDVDIRYPPYTERKLKLLRWLS
jgi:aldehyde dehydrogenase (NAD+)